jgi:hypothetical protein
MSESMTDPMPRTPTAPRTAGPAFGKLFGEIMRDHPGADARLVNDVMRRAIEAEAAALPVAREGELREAADALSEALLPYGTEGRYYTDPEPVFALRRALRASPTPVDEEGLRDILQRMTDIFWAFGTNRDGLWDYQSVKSIEHPTVVAMVKIIDEARAALHAPVQGERE